MTPNEKIDCVLMEIKEQVLMAPKSSLKIPDSSKGVVIESLGRLLARSDTLGVIFSVRKITDACNLQFHEVKSILQKLKEEGIILAHRFQDDEIGGWNNYFQVMPAENFLELVREALPNLTAKEKNVDIEDYVDAQKIERLRLVNSQFDYSRLVRKCEEINAAWKGENFISVALLLRSIINHIAPVFGFKTFGEVANNYGEGGRSFKELMKKLDESARKIADKYAHEPIRKKEDLPGKRQVDFRQELDALLGEVMRVSSPEDKKS